MVRKSHDGSESDGGTLVVERESGLLTTIEFRTRWMFSASENMTAGDLGFGGDAVGNATCAGRVACGHATCAGRVACGNTRGGRNVGGETAESLEALFAARGAGLPRKTASFRELLAAKAEALSFALR